MEERQWLKGGGLDSPDPVKAVTSGSTSSRVYRDQSRTEAVDRCAFDEDVSVGFALRISITVLFENISVWQLLASYHHIALQMRSLGNKYVTLDKCINVC